MTISLSDLKAKRAAMTEAGTPWCVQGPWPQATIYVDNAAIEDDSIHPTHVATMAASVLNGQSTTDDPDATGIVATHNAADVLIEIAKAALAWRDQRADNLLAALARTDAEIEAEAQDVSRACVKRTAELASALERALAKIKP